MNIRRSFPILALAAAVAVTGTAFAQGHHGHGAPGGPGTPGGPGMGPDLDRFVRHLSVVLELSDAQQTQIDAIATAAGAEIEPIATQLAAEREAYREANPLGTFNEADFRVHASAQSDQRIELMVIVHRAMNDVWNVLTPDQQTQVGDMMDRLHDGRGHGPGGKRGFFGRHGARGDCPYDDAD